VDATVWDEGERRKSDNACEVRAGRWTQNSPRQSVPRQGGQTMARLIRTIESEIIPRLLLALQSGPSAIAPDGVGSRTASADDVAEFARLVATHDVSVAMAYVNVLLGKGVPLDRIYLELLAPSARLLGEWWKDDLRDFTEVTSGLCRMHQLLHEFSERFLRDARQASPSRSVLLVPMPGEQHSFGLIMVGEFFRRAGWDVWDPHPSSTEDLLAVVRKQWFAVIGLSLSCGARLGELTPLIASVRAKSRNRAIGVLVGGQPFLGHYELAVEVGADATANDGRSAPLAAARLVDSLQRPV
jgi:MerR family transcriptional regulator, light-induced transcriptional regulator